MQSTYESARLSALRRYKILDTPPEQDFDRITAMGARLFDIGACCITLVDSKRFFFKSACGAEVGEMKREPGFCDTTIQRQGVYWIEDTAKEPQLEKNSLVAGEPFIRFYAGSPLRTSDGYAIGTLCIFDPQPRSFSVTEQKLLEELAEFAMFHLDRRRLQADVKQREEEAGNIQKLESLGLLAGGIAHDFNNLLVGILGNASLAGNQLDKPEQAHEAISNITHAATQAKALTDQLLAYAGQRPLSLEPVDLKTLLDDMQPLIRSVVARNNVIEIHENVGLARAFADATQIRQVILNLLSNASEAYEGTPGTISVNLSSIELSSLADQPNSLAELHPGTYVVLKVVDYGRGMNQETLNAAFDPFFTTKTSGRGLGMSIVQRIVRGHAGVVHVETNPDEGCTVTVYLPAVVDNAVDIQPPTAAGMDSLCGSGTVLVVEDDDLVASMVGSAMRYLGFDVVTATDGTAALEYVSKPTKISALLLDATLPGLSGAETLDAVRKLRPDLPTVVTSGHHIDEVACQFDDFDNLVFLPKPWTVDGLSNALRDAISAR